MPRNVHPTPFVIQPGADFVAKRPDLRRASQALSQKYVDQLVVTEAELQAIGDALWEALGVQESFEAAHQAAGAAILPMVIESEAADAQALPWETLYHPQHGFLGKSPAFTLTRRTRPAQPTPPTLTKGPLRVLLFTSLPDDVNPEKGRLNVEEEQAQVQEALLPWIAEGRVRLEMPDDGTLAALKKLLKEFDPHVLFLSGHGKFHHQPHTGQPPYGVFLFESETGASDPIKETDIAQALIGANVQAVILSACESGKAASVALNNGLTQRLSAQGIPHVIGMRESVLDIAGIQFARVLCDEVARQERIDVALQFARAAITKPLENMGVAKREAGASALAEQSLGQWPLPTLSTPNPHPPLIDWDFAPQAVEPRRFEQKLNTVSVPPRFVGRRAELREHKSALLKGVTKKLLITGPGGQGKTALAGKLALDLQKAGWRVWAWSARPENAWRDFEFEMELALNEGNAKKYDYHRPRFETDRARADFMLGLLLEQFNGRVVLLLDNLEALQDGQTLAVNDKTVAAWLEAAQAAEGLTLLATSRWASPGWPGAHLQLQRVNYGDFLQIARLRLPPAFWRERERLQRAYAVLGGNGRGLEFLAAAVKDMQPEEEEAFLAALAKTQSDLQANMALAEVYGRLPREAQTLLARLPAYLEPVPAEGVLKLALDLPTPEAALERLVAVSLLEVAYHPEWEAEEYQLPPLVSDWLSEQGLIDDGDQWRDAAADYALYLFENERHTLGQAIITHHALRRTERHAEANRLTLDFIFEPLMRAGFYTALLDEWLPQVYASGNLKAQAEALENTGVINLRLGKTQQSLADLEKSLEIWQQLDDKAGKGTVLNDIATVYQVLGDYLTALTYLEQSLTIRQELNNKAGEGTTLNNIAAVYHAQSDYKNALKYWEKSLAILRTSDHKTDEGTILNNISQIYHAQGDYKTALTYLNQSLAIAQKIGDKAGESQSLNNISQIYHAQGDYSTAIIYLKRSLIIFQNTGDKVGEGQSLNNLGAVYHSQGDYKNALIYFSQALSIRQSIGDKAGEGQTINNIATVHLEQGEYELSLTYCKQALAIHKEIGNKTAEAATLNNISQIYQAQKNLSAAISHLNQALGIQKEIGDKANEGNTLNNLATAHLAQGDGSTALTYLNQSLAISQAIGDKAGEGVALNNIASIYQAQGNHTTALKYLEQSRDIRQSIGDKAGLCATLFNIGHIHAENKQIQKAMNIWVTVYHIAKQINSAPALQALAQLAPQVGLPLGLKGWEKLAQRMQKQAGEG